jgi:hypothetical protein
MAFGKAVQVAVFWKQAEKEFARKDNHNSKCLSTRKNLKRRQLATDPHRQKRTDTDELFDDSGQ